MADFVLGGGIVDLILVLIAGETALLLLLRRFAGRGPAPGGLVASAISGACLLLALRAALGHATWPAIVLPLMAAFVAHLADLRLRWSLAPDHSGPRFRNRPPGMEIPHA